MKKYLSCITLLMTICLLSGCAKFGEYFGYIDPPKLLLKVNAGSQLNLNADKQSSPVVLRVYELDKADSFNSATQVQLFTDASKTLGNSLLYQHQIQVTPGAQTSLKIPVQSNAKMIAFVAGFSNATLAWRQAVKLQKNWGDNPIQVTLDQDGLHVKVVSSKWLNVEKWTQKDGAKGKSTEGKGSQSSGAGGFGLDKLKSLKQGGVGGLAKSAEGAAGTQAQGVATTHAQQYVKDHPRQPGQVEVLDSNQTQSSNTASQQSSQSESASSSSHSEGWVIGGAVAMMLAIVLL